VALFGIGMGVILGKLGLIPNLLVVTEAMEAMQAKVAKEVREARHWGISVFLL